MSSINNANSPTISVAKVKGSQDSTKKAHKGKGSLRNQLIFWIILLSLLPLLILSWLSAQRTTDGLTKAANTALIQTAIAKSNAIRNWFDYRFMDIEVQSQQQKNSLLLRSLIEGWQQEKKSLGSYVRSNDWVKRINQSQNELISLTRQYDYIYDIFLIDKSANILFSVRKEKNLGSNLYTGPFADTFFTKVVTETIKTGKISYSGLERYSPSNNTLASFLTAPLVDQSGELIGVYAIQLKLDRIFSLVNDSINTTETLKHYLVNEEGFLQSPIGTNWDEVLTRKINTKQFKLWHQKHGSASDNSELELSDKQNKSDDIKEMPFSYVSSNGNQVIGIHQRVKIGNISWVLIGEIDSKQALFQADKIANNSIIVLLITILIVFSIAIYLSRLITQPIAALSKNALEIASGKTNELKTFSTNSEIFQLSEAINQMISSRLAIEEALRKSKYEIMNSNARLESQKYALDQHAIVAATDVQGNITSINQKFCDISGYSKDELIGKNHRILNSAYHSTEFFKQMYRTISQGKVWKSDICNRAKSGSIYWVDTTIVPFLNEKRKPESYIAIRADITERKASETALKESEAIARSIFTSVADGIITISNKGIIISSNPAADTIFGYKEKEMINQNVTFVIPESSRKKHSHGFDEAKRDKQHPFLTNVKHVQGLRKDSSTFPLEIAVTEVTVGKLNYYAAMIRDITQKQADEKKKQVLLSIANIKLKIAKCLTEHSSLIIRLRTALSILLELENFKHLKKGAIFLFQSKYQEFENECSIGDFDKTLVDDKVQCKKVNQSKKFIIFDQCSNEQRTTNGNYFAYYIPITNRSVNTNNILGVLALYSHSGYEKDDIILPMLHEVSDIFGSAVIQENARLMLEQASDIAEQNSRLKSEFLASMSHEIRTPMNGVLGMLGLLLNSQLSDDQKHKAYLAQSSAQSLLTLINDILDFSKIEAGKLELEYLDFNLRGVLGEFAEAIALRAQSKGLEIILDVTNIEASMVRGDPGRLRQILNNLVGNAIKFTEQGEIIIKAELIDTQKDNLRFVCSVEDTGIGISEHNISKLFDEFTQVDASTTRKYGGTGLGLSITKKLCELMNGTIKANSKIGKGSSFKFEVDLLRSEKSRQVIPKLDISSLHLLIVDDNKTNREVLRGQLEHWGAKVTEAIDATEALSICLEESNLPSHLGSDKTNFKTTFDVAFLDMQMPNMNGAELAKRLRKNPKLENMKLVMMTSIADRGDLDYFAEIGFSGYFSKPATTSDLFDALAVVVNSSNKPDEKSPFVTHHYLQTLTRDDNTQQSEFSQQHQWAANNRIMLVEDNQINQQVALGLLECFDLMADVAGDGYEALNLLISSPKSHPYNLILMDCQMPDMDGYETTRQIRAGRAGQRYESIAIVAMTANTMQGDRDKCLNAGMNDYIAKPVEPENLFKKLTRWLPNKKPNHTVESKPFKQMVDLTPSPKLTQMDLHPPSNDHFEIWDQQSALKRVMQKSSLLRRLVNLFLNDMPTKIDQLRLAVKDNNIEEVRHLAHTIKGVSANLSGIELQQKAKVMEQAAIDRNIGLFINILKEIEVAFNRLYDCLDEYLEISSKKKIAKQKKITNHLSNKQLTLKLGSLLHRLNSSDYIDPQEIISIAEGFSKPNLVAIMDKLEMQISQFDTTGAIQSLRFLSDESGIEITELRG